MGTLHLHIGTHKTGSTALQNGLAGLRDFLSGHGWTYLADAAKAPGLLSLYHSGVIDGQGRRSLQDDARQICTILGDRNVIISSEMFSGSIGSRYRDADHFAQLFRSLFPDQSVAVVVYLRRQDRFFESIYTQRIHQGEALSFEAFRRSCPPEEFLWYENVLAPYASAFGEQSVCAYVYEDLPPAGIVPHFMRAIVGLEDSEVLREIEHVYDPARTSANHGYTQDALRWATRLNPLLDDEERRVLRTVFQSWLRETKNAFSEYGYFNLEERQELFERVRPSNLRAMAFCGRSELPESWTQFEAPPVSSSTGDRDLELLMRLEVHQAARVLRIERGLAELNTFTTGLQTQITQLSTLIEKLCDVIHSERLQR